MVRNWYARFPQITNNARNLTNNAEEAAKALKEGEKSHVNTSDNAKHNLYRCFMSPVQKPAQSCYPDCTHKSSASRQNRTKKSIGGFHILDVL